MSPRKKTALEKAKDHAYTITRRWDRKQIVVYTGIALVALVAVGNRLLKK